MKSGLIMCFFSNNKKDLIWEQWVHSNGCRKFFLVRRSTVNDNILKSVEFTSEIK